MPESVNEALQTLAAATARLKDPKAANGILGDAKQTAELLRTVDESQKIVAGEIRRQSRIVYWVYVVFGVLVLAWVVLQLLRVLA